MALSRTLATVMTFLLFVVPASFAAQPRSPFDVQATPIKGDSTNDIARVRFTVPADCVLYSERLHFETEDGDELIPIKIPKPITQKDGPSGKEKQEYLRSFDVDLGLASLVNNRLVVKFQGCSNDACFFPEKRTFVLGTNAESKLVFTELKAPAPEVAPSGADWAREMHGFKIVAQQSGFLSANKFLSFLDRAQSGNDNADNPLGRFQNAGRTATVLFILFGGILLNLTPCILPMVPINLAIIGAGSEASSRLSGFKNGAIYGLGMALAYGGLGLAVVLAGAKFGSINSSVWFNVAIMAVFVVMALGMFDVIHIDLTRFSHIGPQKASKESGHLIAHMVIFIMGVMAALLAGACVAPVVISVMLLATNIYAKGNFAGLLLPFVLGAGMAAPWPLAGAGLTFLPKPGKWMKRVKQGFGVMIAVFAVYYAHLALAAFQSFRDATSLAAAPAGAGPVAQNDANQQLAEALREARLHGRPVLLDFRASWCKNCLAMDETVFKRSEVKKRFDDFILVRYDAERPGEAPAREVLDHFGVMGLPTYVVLTATK